MDFPPVIVVTLQNFEVRIGEAPEEFKLGYI